MPQNFPTNRQNPNRKDESIRRANRVIQTRTFVLMLIMGNRHVLPAVFQAV